MLTIVVSIIAGLSWTRFLYLGFTNQLTDANSVGVPIVWTILACVV